MIVSLIEQYNSETYLVGFVKRQIENWFGNYIFSRVTELLDKSSKLLGIYQYLEAVSKFWFLYRLNTQQAKYWKL